MAVGKTFRLLTAFAAGLLWALAGFDVANAAEQLSKDDAAKLKETGAKAFGIQWTGAVHGANERGVVAVTDGTTTLTRRGSRTFIVNNRKASAAGDARAFTGTDDALKKRGMRILEAAGASSKEVLETKVLQQMTSASYGREGKPQAPKKGRRTLLVTRQVDGIHVTSSRLLLDLDANGRIGFMELCWPDLSPETLEMAKRLQQSSKGEFKPPAMESASVESVQPVVIHSPAVAFFDDQVAALQVIYTPNREEAGKKPVRYLDAAGRDVPLPRQMEPLREEPVKREPLPAH
ncbi:MAG: hypothetical protein M3S32_05325 [Acidobacteriota bacterium]|nr:hypothetical protein [Acidobacteriota bacterium]